MNFIRTYECLIAALLVAIYLVLPAANFARAATLEAGLTSMRSPYSSAITVPCDDSPCTDEQGSGCCGTTFCNCACHAPLSQRLLLNYSPLVVTQSFQEQPWSLPQVYRPIFVPPQNHV